jgi:hypothetical protein
MDPRAVSFALRGRKIDSDRTREIERRSRKRHEMQKPTSRSLESARFSSRRIRLEQFVRDHPVTRVNEEECRVKRGYPRDRQVDHASRCPGSHQVCAYTGIHQRNRRAIRRFSLLLQIARFGFPWCLSRCSHATFRYNARLPLPLCLLCRRRAVSLGSLTNWLDRGYSMLSWPQVFPVISRRVRFSF